MKRFLFFMQMIAILAIPTIANAQVDWRFGFEYNELWSWSLPHHEQLLIKLERIGSPGGINVNGKGSWAEMQKSAADPITFETTDPIVTLFQRHSFSFTWYLRCDATWAFPSKQIPDGGTAAPDPAFEEHWKHYIKAIFERYDGDEDMPGLVIPIQFYIMIGEVKFGKTGQGDNEPGPFWFDTIDNLLRLHRLTCQAVREADPTGHSRVVSSGGLLFDLYADFPDWSEFDTSDPNSTVQKRLQGENYRGSTYTAGWDSLKKMLHSFGDDADGIECDYIGWHPHFSWRIIDQEFKLIHGQAGDKPIYIDDMWTNIFAQGYAGGLLIPGEAQFTAPLYPPPNTDWVRAINGDFPNMLFTSIDPYAELFQKLNNGDQAAFDWYYANGARRFVKSFASAFGEGAERVSFSGTNDLDLPGWELGWINLLGTRQEGHPEKPQFYTLKLLVEKLHDFTAVTEISVSANPLTRIYKFTRPRGPVYILWSETGGPPPDLDYRIATGDTVTFEVESAVLILTHIISDTINITPEVDTLIAQNRQITIGLGYEPLILEPIFAPIIPINCDFQQLGWYLASLPVVTANNSVSILFPTALAAFGWNADTQSYYPTATLDTARGYWIAIPSPWSGTTQGVPFKIFTKHYGQGWHLIGSVIDTVDFTNPNAEPDDTVLNPAFGFDPFLGEYVPADTLIPGQGYWIAVVQECDLTIGAETSSSVAKPIAQTDKASFYQRFGSQPPPPPTINWQTGEIIHIPEGFALMQNYPNPFNPETTIKYNLPTGGNVILQIYDILGRLVRTLVNTEQPAGYYEIRWDGKNDRGLSLPSGLYFYRIHAGEFNSIRKLLIIK